MPGNNREYNKTLDEIKQIHTLIKKDIKAQLENFDGIWRNYSEEDIFCELVFCLLTPQSGAYRCWKAVQVLRSKDLIFNGYSGDICSELNIVRFKNKKSVYICMARDLFTIDGNIAIKKILSQHGAVFSRREWLVKNVKGMGFKEASHFLRNTGFGADIAILDRHILKNLKLFGVITDIPSSISRHRYLDIESRMRDFSAAVGIPLAHLDFVLWYKEAGSVFK